MVKCLLVSTGTFGGNADFKSSRLSFSWLETPVETWV